MNRNQAPDSKTRPTPSARDEIRRLAGAIVLLGVALCASRGVAHASSPEVDGIRHPAVIQVGDASTDPTRRTSGDAVAGTLHVDVQTGSTHFVPAEASGPGPDALSRRLVPDEMVYDNVGRVGDATTGFGYLLTENPVFGDPMVLSEPGRLQFVGFTPFFYGGSVTSVTFRIEIFDATGWSGFGYPATSIVAAESVVDYVSTFGPTGLPSDTRVTLGFDNWPGGFELPQEVLVTYQVIGYEGTPTVVGAYVTGNQTPYAGSSDPATSFFASDIAPTGLVHHVGIPNNNLEMRVGACTAPDVQVSPASIFAAAGLGQNILLLEWIQISNVDGCAPLEYSISSDCGLSASPGSVPVGEVRAIDLSFRPFGVGPGSHSGNLVVSTNDPDTPNTTVPVSFTITGTMGNAQPGIGYATQGPGGSTQWVEIDLTTGAGTVSGWTGYPVPGLATLGGVLLAGGADDAYWQIDSVTGAMARIGNEVVCMDAMASTDDIIMGIGCDGDLHRIDPFTGFVSPPDLTGISPAMGGLAIDPVTETVYFSQAATGAGMDHLYSWGGAGAPVVDRGSLGLGWPIHDLACDENGSLFALAGWPGAIHLVWIDPSRVQATVIGPTGVDALDALVISGPAPGVPTSAETPTSSRFALRGASPNPFNPATEISFDLDRGGRVQLVVYDAAGRRVSTLIDETMPAGPHSILFRAEELGSGTYFYELRSGGHREARKMTLVK